MLIMYKPKTPRCETDVIEVDDELLIDIIKSSDNGEKDKSLDRLKKNGTFYLKGVIKPSTLEELYFDLLEAIANDDIEEITIYIHSEGGYTFDYLPLVDLIRCSPKKVITIGMGQVMSGAVLILISGHDRRAHQHCTYMIHDVHMSAGYQSHKEAMGTVRLHDHLMGLHDKLIMDMTSISTEEDLKQAFNAGIDNYFDSQKALEYGLIDEVILPRNKE